jgi:tetratricopeptide (TPR) repeat protein
MEAGRYSQALGIYEEAVADIQDPEWQRQVEEMTCYLHRQMGASYWKPSEVLERYRQWLNPDTAGGRWSFALPIPVMALVDLDSLDAARAAVARWAPLEATSGGWVKFFTYRLMAQIQLAEGDPEGAIESLMQVSNFSYTPGGLSHIEKAEWLARAYRMANRLDEAADVHLELLRIYGSHARSHYALGQIYEEMGHLDEASAAYERFLEFWFDADEGLPELVDARKRLSALTAG